MSAVVVDTNVLIRAFLSGKLADDKILRLIIRGKYQLIYGRNQLKEFTRVLGYARITKKYHIDKSAVRALLIWIVDRGIELEPEKTEICRDPDDNYILGLAISAAKNRKTYLISGDADILSIKKKIPPVTILTPGEFIKNQDKFF